MYIALSIYTYIPKYIPTSTSLTLIENRFITARMVYGMEYQQKHVCGVVVVVAVLLFRKRKRKCLNQSGIIAASFEPLIPSIHWTFHRNIMWFIKKYIIIFFLLLFACKNKQANKQ